MWLATVYVRPLRKAMRLNEADFRLLLILR